MTLNDIQEAPSRNLILLVGLPGSGKSTFCHQTALATIENEPIIYVTTESAPSKVFMNLQNLGLGKVPPHPIGFVDAYHKTMGLSESTELWVEEASSENLVSLGIAIEKIRRRLEKKFLLIFDSLTSPYLMNGKTTLLFLRKTLLRLTSEGNSAMVGLDEGCGKTEDMVAMMSMADGIVKIGLEHGTKTFNVIKHPHIKPTEIRVPLVHDTVLQYRFDLGMHMHHSLTAMGLKGGPRLRKHVGDSVNLFWPNFARWNGMLWDPKRFPTMTYYSNKKIEFIIEEAKKLFPLKAKVFFKLLMPKDFNDVGAMKKLMKYFRRLFEGDRGAITEYDPKKSKKGEHYLRLYESGTCWGLDGVGASLHLGMLGAYAGALKGFENKGRDWNIVETKCIGLGHPYCELKIVPGEIRELKTSLESMNSNVLDAILDRMTNRLVEYILEGKPLWKNRPKLGMESGLHSFSYKIQSPAMSSERYRMAMRFGGVLAGKKIGNRLTEAGLSEEESIESIRRFMEYCKVGKVTIGDTVKIVESCESFTIKAKEPYCFFTTGFLNGFFSALKNQHVKERKCVALGDPICEWEFD